jgi:hypothetical protein
VQRGLWHSSAWIQSPALPIIHCMNFSITYFMPSDSVSSCVNWGNKLTSKC